MRDAESTEQIDLIVTQDGSHSLFTHQFSDTYHSTFGAIQESQHVFIEHGLAHFQGMTNQIHILELGFGTGLNVALTLKAYLEDQSYQINYEALEAYPIDTEIALRLNYGNQLSLPGFEVLHQLDWNQQHRFSPHFSLKKRFEKFEELSDKSLFDLVYYDAFSPTSQPHLWGADMVSKVATAMKDGGCLVSYCAQGAFRRVLRDLGFIVESLPGPPGKREMTRAFKGKR